MTMGKIYSASAKGRSYYAQKLSATRLKQVYDLASEPVRHYLAAEIDHVQARLPVGGRVLELGCGYGRVLKALRPSAGPLVGIDTSYASLDLARGYLAGFPDVMLALMDAYRESKGTLPPSLDIGHTSDKSHNTYLVDKYGENFNYVEW